MKKQKNTNKGITLIALIITIIVLLILAGVALSMLTGDSGILNNAESAKNQTNLANSKEQVGLAIQGALTEGLGTVTKVNLVEELDKLLGAGAENYTIIDNETGSWTVTVTKTGYSTTISSTGKTEENAGGGPGGGGDTATLPTRTGTTPWLPSASFSQVEGTNLTNGLVITNTAGTQNYVWIEVPTTIEEEITLSDGTSKEVILANAANDEEIALILEAYAGDYTKGSSSQDYSEWKDEWYDSNGNTEGTEGVKKEDTAGCGMKYEQYQEAYSKMLNSIKNNGGFWLAQYEAGIAYEGKDETATNRTSHTAIGDNPSPANYAQDQYPYNWVDCSEAQKIANADSVEGKYTSSLPFGIQWDLVCKFLEVNTELTYDEIATQSTWGNYVDTTFSPRVTAKYLAQFVSTFAPVYVNGDTEQYKKTSTSPFDTVLLTTGAIEATTTSAEASPMNIYDFAGNVSEWTLERSCESISGIPAPCVERSGRYGVDSSTYPASIRSASGEDGWSGSTGFRSVLY